MRLFIALDIEDDIRQRIARFADGVSPFAPDARWAKPESLHLTLKFIGEQPDSAIEQIQRGLSGVSGSAVDIQFGGYGFFPTAKSARVFWVGVSAGPALATLASTIDEKMSALGIAREDRAFTPHLTLARAAGRSASPRRGEGELPNRIFELLQKRLAGLSPPEFGSMTARKFFLYQSQLSPKGSKYTKLAGFDLK